MEYLPHGDLEGCLNNTRDHEAARQITQQVLEGLYSMHKNNFAHRDLKPGVSSPTDVGRSALIQCLEHFSSPQRTQLVSPIFQRNILCLRFLEILHPLPPRSRTSQVPRHI